MGVLGLRAGCPLVTTSAQRADGRARPRPYSSAAFSPRGVITTTPSSLDGVRETSMGSLCLTQQAGHSSLRFGLGWSLDPCPIVW
jgi:hypothetical protein